MTLPSRRSRAACGPILAAAVLFAAGCSDPTGPERPLDGAVLYRQHCARCHGPDGRGVPQVPGVRDLTDARVIGNLRNDQIKMAIRMGKPPRMPAFGDRFTDAALEVLVAYVRSLAEGAGPPAEAPPATP